MCINNNFFSILLLFFFIDCNTTNLKYSISNLFNEFVKKKQNEYNQIEDRFKKEKERLLEKRLNKEEERLKSLYDENEKK